MLEEVRHEPAEILALLGQLLDERQRAGGVAVDDEVAEPEERLFLDGPEQLQDVLDRDLLVCRRRELVERRDGVAIGATRSTGDERERRVWNLDLLAVGDPPQHAHELGQTRPRESEGLAA